jgi:hypothetical protein
VSAVLEVALLDVRSGQGEAFEASFREAQSITIFLRIPLVRPKR